MKKNHSQVENLVRQAIQSCNNDFALQEASTLLYRVLASVSEVGRKRAKRNVYVEHYAEKANNLRAEWLKTVQESAKKMADLEDGQQNTS